MCVCVCARVCVRLFVYSKLMYLNLCARIMKII